MTLLLLLTLLLGGGPGSGNAEATFAIGDTYTGANVRFRVTGHYYV